jgi:hypothetical protein
MKKIVFTIISVLLLISKQSFSADNKVEGVLNPVVNINGTWKINTNPTGNFWEVNVLNDEWKDIQVPGEVMMQGFPIKHDKTFVYKKQIKIPADFAGKEIKLQFEGVYSYARVWVNGNYLREHYGGFTRWDCNITPFVKPGETAMITLEVTDKADDISYGSGYAKHQIGGILRDVNLLALPENYLTNLNIVTDLDNDFNNADLTITGKLNNVAKNIKVKLHLTDNNNSEVPLQNSTIELNKTAIFNIKNLVQSPVKWDAEHPNLYNLKISLFENEKLIFEKTEKFGFREVVVIGNKLLVNGMEVKLRGACRHDIHPLLGRVSTPDYELKDVLLAKEANMNFIRTSHYPPTENFLRLCDEYGLYVESETAVCFVGSHRTADYKPGNSENDPNFTSIYLSQLKEMVKTQINHPSIIMWSVGNENHYGTNFKKSYDWVKGYDKTRPVIFSYPGYVPDTTKCYDILSMHYPGISGDMTQHRKTTKAFGYDKMPVIFDEWAHVACYNPFTIKEDPNIRDFWGESLDTMWKRVFEADGGLGGAIWGMIDETFMLPVSLPGFNEWWGKIDKNIIPPTYTGNTIGYGEWGIIDTWRRKKPEFWNTKKAYSPAKLLQTTFDKNVAGNTLEVLVYNRFDHTNFNELTIKYSYGNKEKTLNPVDVKPHTKGTLYIPLDKRFANEPVCLEIFDAYNTLVDKYILRVETEDKTIKREEPSGKISYSENESQLTIICENNIKIVFDKTTGLIKNIGNSSEKIPFSGPYLNFRTKGKSLAYSNFQINEYCNDWKLKDFSFKQNGNKIFVSIKGKYSDISSVEFAISISPDGKTETRYQISKIPKEYIREIGIRFEMENEIDSLSWKRDSYWSYYPADQLSVPEGKIALYSEVQSTYRNMPEKEWAADSKSFYYNGTDNELLGENLTNIAKATKEKIQEYNLYKKGQKVVSVTGNGDISCRIAKKENRIILFANNKMDYIDLSWGNYQHNILLDKKYSNKVEIIINTAPNK